MNTTRQSLIVALYNFRNELKELNLPTDKILHLMEKFRDAYLRSGDYDLAYEEVFDEVMQLIESKKTKSEFEKFWKKKSNVKISDRRKTVHFSDLDRETYLSILDQLREAVKEGIKEGKTEWEIAWPIAQEYNLYFNDVLSWVINRMNTRADLFGTYEKNKEITKQDEEELVRRAKSIIAQAKKQTTNLADIIGAVAIGLGISYALATKIAEKTNIANDIRNKYFGSGSIML